MCAIIELKCGVRWETLRRASQQDLNAGEMVIVCPRCHVAFVVQDKVQKLVVSV